MYKSVRLRTLFQVVLAVLVALPTLLGSLTLAFAGGGGPNVVINEVNYGGSVTDPTDNYVELFNPTADSVSIEGYSLWSASAEMVTLHGSIAASGYYVVSHNAVTNSVLVASDLVDSHLVLSPTSSTVILRDASGTPVDTANSLDGKSVAGSTKGVIAAEERLSTSKAYQNGTLADSWFTASTHGVGLKPGVAQYGTPGAINTEVGGVAVNVGMKPAFSTTIASMPTITGTATTVQTLPASASTQVTAQFMPISGGTAATYTTSTIAPVTGLFSITPSPALAAGTYRVVVTVQDALGNSSAPMTVTTGTSPDQNLYTVQATSVEVPVPVLDPVNSLPNLANSSLVNTATVNVTGTVQAGTALVFSVNGQDVEKTPALDPSQTHFSLVVKLNPDQLNSIEVRAQDAAGNTSAPVVATVTQDSTAPAPIVTSLTAVSSNAAGVQDTIAGLAGSVEPKATVEVYADAALTTPIAKGISTATGSFGPLSLGAQKYKVVYAVARDAAGNENPLNVRSFTNGVAFSGPVAMTVTTSGITQTQATVNWQPVTGAVTYHFKYKTGTGAYSAPIDVCAGVTTCPTSRTLISLTAGTTYTVAMVPVDRFGTEATSYTEVSFVTTAIAAVGGSSTIEALPTTTPAPAATATPAPVVKQVATTKNVPVAVTTTPVPEATATPAPSPTDEGQVQSAETTTHNYTPWIILAILVALAILATAGYFYWFGGEEEEMVATPSATDLPPVNNKVVLENKETTPVVKKSDPTTAPPKDKPNKNEKRW